MNFYDMINIADKETFRKIMREKREDNYSL